MSDTSDRSSHDEILGQLSALLDGELDAAEAERIRRHLDTCAGCAEAWRRTRSLSDAMRSLPREPMPARLEQRILATRRPGPLLRRPWILATAASAALIIVLSAVLLRVELPVPEAEPSFRQEAAKSAERDDAGPVASPSPPPPPAETQRSRPVREESTPAQAPAVPLDEIEPRSGQERKSALRKAESKEVEQSDSALQKAEPAVEGFDRSAPAAANEAAGEVTGATPGARAAGPRPARWSTRAVPGPDGGLSLEPLAPDDAGAAGRSLQDRTEPDEIVVTLLAQVGEDGTVSRTEPVGPVPVSGEVLERIRRLVEMQRLPGEAETGSGLVIRVRLPSRR